MRGRNDSIGKYVNMGHKKGGGGLLLYRNGTSVMVMTYTSNKILGDGSYTHKVDSLPAGEGGRLYN